ncbi:MAG: serine/threonine-protein kinase [Vicinamibacteria bacterium]
MITRESWERAKELFGQALLLPAPDRAAFLGRASADDEPLRRELESLVASLEAAGGFLETSSIGAAADVGTPPARVGPYRLLDLVGRGGMGEVYRAVRDDDHFKKVVAVKLVRADVASAFREDRLRAERQMLACLEHPGIARLLDGGAGPDGRPFLVMEFVEGVPLDEYASEHDLDTRSRVALFRSVCAAVQHAHQNLIVHRDLKPANILVTPEGAPKLLDFGVAKLLEDPLADEATATAFPAMTPAYASPELVRGEPITTASDVYSLGAVLYELLTGVRAHRLTGSTSIHAAVCEIVPPRPSSVVQAPPREPRPFRRRSSRAIASDLDAIVMKALRKEPSRRYPTVDALSEDLRRYLEGLPVTAARGTIAYRTVRFVRRNRLALALTAAVAGLAAAYVVNDVVQARQQARLRQRAERVTALLVEVFKVADPNETRGESVTAREILDQGAARVDTELADEPEVRAELLHTLGRVHERLGLYAKAASLHERGLATRRAVLGARHPEVAESLASAGEALYRTGDHARGEAYHREALALRRALYGDESLPVAESLTDVGRAVYALRVEDPESEALQLAALAIRRKLLPAGDPAIAVNLMYLGFVRRDRGDYDAAEALQRECLAIRRRAFPGASKEVAITLNNIGAVVADKGDYAGADAAFGEALDIRTRIYGPDHPTLATPLVNLAQVRRQRGDAAGAAELLRRAIAITERVHGPAHVRVAPYLSLLGAATCDAGDCAAAEVLQRRALAMTREQWGPRHLLVQTRLAELADTLSARGRWPEAEAALREALDIASSKRPTGEAEYAAIVTALAEARARQGDAAGALAFAHEGLAIRQRLLPPGHPAIAVSESVLGAALGAAGRIEEARALLQRSQAAIVARQGPRSRAARDAAARAGAL